MVMNGVIKGEQGSVLQTHRMVCAALAGDRKGQGDCTSDGRAVLGDEARVGAGAPTEPRSRRFTSGMGPVVGAVRGPTLHSPRTQCGTCPGQLQGMCGERAAFLQLEWRA